MFEVSDGRGIPPLRWDFCYELALLNWRKIWCIPKYPRIFAMGSVVVSFVIVSNKT